MSENLPDHLAGSQRMEHFRGRAVNKDMRVEECREQSQKCHRLAQREFDIFVREALLELATHLEREAELLERREKRHVSIH
jgi:hypothetical protein